MDVERLLAAVVEDVGLIEAGHYQDAALAAVPGLLPGIPGLELLDGGIDEREARLTAVGQEAPAHHPPGDRAIEGEDDRYRVRRQDAPARLEMPQGLDDPPVPLGGGLGRCLIAGAHAAYNSIE